jgi:uncharacterized protein YbjT (DUF2867 family)
VAEAFALAWVSWRKVREHPVPRAWVVRTALNAHVPWWRRQRRELTVDGRTALTFLENQPERPADPGIDEALAAAIRYFGMKLATERTVEQSGIGWSTLRATQFHDLILMVVRTLARLPVIPAPTGSRFQPVDATEVAERMAELALGEPSGLVPDLAGPKIYTMAELVNSYLSAAGKRRPLVPVHIPGRAARALRAGANLAPDRAVGKRTWEVFLADRI